MQSTAPYFALYAKYSPALCTVCKVQPRTLHTVQSTGSYFAQCAKYSHRHWEVHDIMTFFVRVQKNANFVCTIQKKQVRPYFSVPYTLVHNNRRTPPVSPMHIFIQFTDYYSQYAKTEFMPRRSLSLFPPLTSSSEMLHHPTPEERGEIRSEGSH